MHFKLTRDSLGKTDIIFEISASNNRVFQYTELIFKKKKNSRFYLVKKNEKIFLFSIGIFFLENRLFDALISKMISVFPSESRVNLKCKKTYIFVENQDF